MCHRSTALCTGFQVDAGLAAIATHLFWMALARRNIEVGLADRVFAAQVFQKGLERINHVPKFLSLEVSPFVKMNGRVHGALTL